MRGRLWLAGILAGVAVFAWGSVSHLVLKLGDAGVQAMPDEGPVVAAMSQNLKSPGFYYYPAAGAVEGDRAKMEAAWKTQPHGILIYTPPDGAPLPLGRLMAIQLGLDVVGGLIAAFLLATAVSRLPGFFGRVLFVAMLGAFAILLVDGPYWNWYGFPMSYLLARLVDGVVGWSIGGAVLAGMIKSPA